MAEPVTDLEGLARKATPGPWRASGVVIWSPENPVDPTDFSGGAVAYTPELDEHGVPDAAYIAAASPDVILALLEAARRATEENVALREALSVEGLTAAIMTAVGSPHPDDFGIAYRDKSGFSPVGLAGAIRAALLATSTPSEESEAGT